MAEMCVRSTDAVKRMSSRAPTMSGMAIDRARREVRATAKAVVRTIRAPGRGMLNLIKPVFPLLFPLLLPKMMSKVMPTMLERVGAVIPMPDYMAEQMPDLMPKVMDNLMPHMIGDVVPLVTDPMIEHLTGGNGSK